VGKPAPKSYRQQLEKALPQKQRALAGTKRVSASPSGLPLGIVTGFESEGGGCQSDVYTHRHIHGISTVTTEIAVANRLGIALATDSAVTVSGGGHVKVFDTADKLFELSSKFPVGVMINGNMDCMGVPWEILVKDFNDQKGGQSRPSIKKWGNDFLAYVESYPLLNEDGEGGYIDRVIRTEIILAQNTVLQFVRKQIFDTARAGKGHILSKGDLDVRKVLATVIAIRKNRLNENPVAPSLKKISAKVLHKKHASRIKAALVKAFYGQKLSAKEIAALTDLIVQAMIRSRCHDHSTGIVVAGYGSTETFPSVFSAEVEGRINGKLKIVETKVSSIQTSMDGGEVTSFAQTDVIERLLKGADPRFVRSSADFIERAFTQVLTSALDAAQGNLTEKKKGARDAMITALAKAAREEYATSTAEELKTSFSREFDRMIAMMPKQELIELAEALVSITAVERKATVDEGTVGGPIDVAFITKHEGFAWIKRKHYFSKDLDPRFFWRKPESAPSGSPRS
jgi:hypothetical protein